MFIEFVTYNVASIEFVMWNTTSLAVLYLLFKLERVTHVRSELQ